jgi:hypothetical protein
MRKCKKGSGSVSSLEKGTDGVVNNGYDKGGEEGTKVNDETARSTGKYRGIYW